MNDETPHNVVLSGDILAFAWIYAGIAAGLVVLIQVVATAGVTIPNAVATGAGLGAFMAAAGIAGQRYAVKTNFGWTREDRAQLAIGYVVASLAVQLILVIVLVTLLSVFDPQVRLVVQQMAANQSGVGALAIFVAAGLA